MSKPVDKAVDSIVNSSRRFGVKRPDMSDDRIKEIARKAEEVAVINSFLSFLNAKGVYLAEIRGNGAGPQIVTARNVTQLVHDHFGVSAEEIKEISEFASEVVNKFFGMLGS